MTVSLHPSIQFGNSLTGWRPCSSIQVINYDPHSSSAKTERDLFSALFMKPIKEMYVNDAYLYDRERIVDRLGAYIELANEQNKLDKVTVRTKSADEDRISSSLHIQNGAIKSLRQKYPNVDIDFKRSNPDHDRFIILTRTDGSQARILIGQGLDFIQSNRRNRPTYIVIEDPYIS